MMGCVGLRASFAAFVGLMMRAAAHAATLLLRNPALSQDRITFLHANDIRLVPRQGRDARRVTVVGDVVAGLNADEPRWERR